MLSLLLGTFMLMLIPQVALAADSFTVPKDLSDPVGFAYDHGRNVIWVGSVNAPKVQALSMAGELLGTISYRTNQPPKQLETLTFALGKLYLGDIGGKRSSIRLIRLNSLKYGNAQTTTLTLRYSDGRHEAKALAISPKGNVYVITTGVSPAIYRAIKPNSNKTAVLTRIADVPQGIVGGTFTPDGKKLVLRTADQVIVLNAYTMETVASAYTETQPGASALTLISPNKLLLFSRDTSVPVIQMPLPKQISTVRPTPSPTTTPNPMVTPNPATTPSIKSTPATKQDNSAAEEQLGGTKRALLIAVGVALIAGLVVVVKR